PVLHRDLPAFPTRRSSDLELVHEEKHDWAFFRKAAEQVFWPHVEQEYREEIEGIAEGLKARGGKLDVWDLVALNAWLEIPYYDKDRKSTRLNSSHVSISYA